MMKLVYDPRESGPVMTIVCFISGSGTNYREIVAGNPGHKYLVFTNRPGCGGVALARQNGHDVVEVSHLPFLDNVAQKYGAGSVPRNCPERIVYEKEVIKLIRDKLKAEPDLICLAGYDQWLSDWMVEKYYPRIFNVHPGDSTKGYDGLHWIPSARAILAGDEELRSTLFFVDKGEDTGPVLVQSAPLDIKQAIGELESKGENGIADRFSAIGEFARSHGTYAFEAFKEKASESVFNLLEMICKKLQNELKVRGDWKIYPFAVGELIAKGRVGVNGREVYLDGKKLPTYGYRIGSSD
jgi:phosphoribosylglycinamide formyltransferase 1